MRLWKALEGKIAQNKGAREFWGFHWCLLCHIKCQGKASLTQDS